MDVGSFPKRPDRKEMSDELTGMYLQRVLN